MVSSLNQTPVSPGIEQRDSEGFHVGRDISIPNSHPAPKIVPALGSLILILLSSLDLMLAPLSPTSLPEPGCRPGLAVGLFPCSVDLPPT